MSFDTADPATMEPGGTLDDVITHQMGHMPGSGTLWTRTSLLADAAPTTSTGSGSGAVRECAVLTGRTEPDVPVENTG